MAISPWLSHVNQTGLESEREVLLQPHAQAGHALWLLQETESAHLRAVFRAGLNLLRTTYEELPVARETVVDIGKGRLEPAAHVIADGVAIGARESCTAGGSHPLCLFDLPQDLEVGLTAVASGRLGSLGHKAEADATSLPPFGQNDGSKDNLRGEH